MSNETNWDDAVQRLAEPVKRVCAWCGLVMARGAEPATHGICEACAEQWKRANTSSLEE